MAPPTPRIPPGHLRINGSPSTATDPPPYSPQAADRAPGVGSALSINSSIVARRVSASILSGGHHEAGLAGIYGCWCSRFVERRGIRADTSL
jgi:hypothetical protein